MRILFVISLLIYSILPSMGQSTLSCFDLFKSDSLSLTTLNEKFNRANISTKKEYYSCDFEFLGNEESINEDTKKENVYVIKTPVYQGVKLYDFFKLGKVYSLNIIDSVSLTGTLETTYLHIKQIIEFQNGFIYKITYTNKKESRLYAIYNYGVNLFSKTPQWVSIEYFKRDFDYLEYEKRLILVCDGFKYEKLVDEKYEKFRKTDLGRIK